jgi:hypothetical protein
MAKSKPIGVRFDLEKLELIQKEQNLSSPQAVVNHFLDGYKSIYTKKTLLEIIDTTGEPNILANTAPNSAFKLENVTNTANNIKIPPKGLKGIDLAIWKSENWK